MIFDLGYYVPSNPKLQPSSQANPAAFELLKIESFTFKSEGKQVMFKSYRWFIIEST